MKALILNKRISQDGSTNRSTSRSHQFKQVISMLFNGMPEGHFLAYCLVSKQSQLGLFANDKLLAINSKTKEIHLYSLIPKLPLKHISQLPVPKEIVKITPAVQFIIQKTSNGQIIIKSHEQQIIVWRLTMGSHKMGIQFFDIFQTIMKTVQQVQEQKSLQIEQKFSTNNNFTMSNINILDEDKQSQQQLSKSFFENKFKIKQAPKQDLNKLMIHNWIISRSQRERSEIYNKFINRCMKKVQSIMNDFLANHQIHQKYTHLNVLRDNQIQIYYLPLINSTEEEDLLDPQLHKIEQEQSILQQWQCLNYLASFTDQLQDIKILTPMICKISFKSFLFYCKNSIQQYPIKQKINAYQYSLQMTKIEKAIHLKLFNNKEQIFAIRRNNEVIFYFNRLSCLPKLSNSFLIPSQYINLFIKQGVVSNKKDIDAIYTHISNNLTNKIKQKWKEISFFSSIQLMTFLQQQGLSYHYLPLLLSNEQDHTYSYVQKLVASQIISCAMSWELRRRMQVPFFKNKQLDFAVAQLKITLSLLLKEDKIFIGILQRIIKHMFNFAFTNILPLKNIIQIQTTILSIFHRVGFNCKATFLTQKRLDWIWTANYINDYIELTPYIDCQMMCLQLFCKEKDVIKNKLVGQINNEINFQMQMQEVFNVLNIGKGSSPIYTSSDQYSILPFTLKMKTDYFFSHYISPHFQAIPNSLSTQIYSFIHYYTHSLQYLTVLNKLRWLARMKSPQKVSEMLDLQIQKAIIWNQFDYLINLYSFYAKYKLKEGQTSKGLQYTLQALQYSLLQYKKDPTIINELVTAEQAFQAANFHYSMQNYVKAFELYETVESVLIKVKTSSHKLNLNEQFLQLYINKCSIYILYGQYQDCFKHCIIGINSCQKFKNAHTKNNTIKYQFKIYQILFRCYQIKNMHNQVIQLANLCSKKYLQLPLYKRGVISMSILGELIKMVWISVIKQIQLEQRSSILSGKAYQANLKAINLKKVRKEINSLRMHCNQAYRYGKDEAFTYLSRRILKYQQNQYQFRLTQQIINCLAQTTRNSQQIMIKKPNEKDAANDERVMLQVLTFFVGYSFMVGCIDDYLHLYSYQY